MRYFWNYEMDKAMNENELKALYEEYKGDLAEDGINSFEEMIDAETDMTGCLREMNAEEINNLILVEEAEAFDNLATVSKMDCWFFIDEVNGEYVVKDLEDNNKVLGNENGILMLLDGATDEDFERLSERDIETILKWEKRRIR